MEGMFANTELLTGVDPKNRMKFTNIIGDICLDGIDLELISISLNKKILKPKEYKQKEKEIVIFSPPKNCTIEVITNIHPIQEDLLNRE